MDLVHCQGYHTLVAPLAMLTALRARIPYVVTFHSGGHGSALRRSVRPLQAWLLRPLLIRAGRLIAVSDFEAALFARRLRIPLGAIEVIPSGVTLPEVEDAQSPSGPPLILSIGRLERYKGHHRVLEAVPAVNEARPGTRLEDRRQRTGGAEAPAAGGSARCRGSRRDRSSSAEERKEDWPGY